MITVAIGETLASCVNLIRLLSIFSECTCEPRLSFAQLIHIFRKLCRHLVGYNRVGSFLAVNIKNNAFGAPCVSAFF